MDILDIKAQKALNRLVGDHVAIYVDNNLDNYDVKEDYDTVNNLILEHKQYKDLEEELGINLFTFVEVLKAPEIYIKKRNKIITIPHCDICWDIVCNSIAVVLEEDKTEGCMRTVYGIYDLRSYGKTWSLNREDLK